MNRFKVTEDQLEDVCGCRYDTFTHKGREWKSVYIEVVEEASGFAWAYKKLLSTFQSGDDFFQLRHCVNSLDGDDPGGMERFPDLNMRRVQPYEHTETRYA